MSDIVLFKQRQEAFENEKVYTRADVIRALAQQDEAIQKAMKLLGVIRVLPNGDRHHMQVRHVYRTLDGIQIIVS